MELVHNMSRPSRRLGPGMGQNEVMDNGIQRLSPRHARGVYRSDREKWVVDCVHGTAGQSFAVKTNPTAGRTRFQIACQDTRMNCIMPTDMTRIRKVTTTYHRGYDLVI